MIISGTNNLNTLGMRYCKYFKYFWYLVLWWDNHFHLTICLLPCASIQWAQIYGPFLIFITGSEYVVCPVHTRSLHRNYAGSQGDKSTLKLYYSIHLQKQWVILSLKNVKLILAAETCSMTKTWHFLHH